MTQPPYASHPPRHTARRAATGEGLLFLTDAQLRQAIELMFFAYRGFTADPDKILENYAYGRAHHRALHFVNRHPGVTVSTLISILGVTKQSLNRVLRRLIEDALIEARVGRRDRRERNLHLTAKGKALEAELAEVQSARMRQAFREAGPEAVQGFRIVLEHMADPQMRRFLDANHSLQEAPPALEAQGGQEK